MINKKTFTAVFGALLASLAASADVFSDAATWHQGFYGSGTRTSGSKTAFPDKLRAGDSSSNYHSTTVVGNASGVSLESGTVEYPNPYSPNTTLVSRNETFAHLPQSASGSYAGIQLVNPFAVTNTASFTFFVRLKWDGSVRTAPASFLYAGYNSGNKAGFRLGIQSSGNIQVYSTAGVTEGKNYKESASAMVTANVWTDVAIVVADHKLTVYTLTPGSSILSSVITEHFAEGSSASKYYNTIKLGCESASNANPFPGDIHSFASWPRALSEDEVKQVFAYPSTADLVRLGTKNGSSAEFAGATQGGAASGSVTEDWAQISPALTTASPSQSIVFNVPTHYAGVAQVLRAAFATDSASGTVNVSIGATKVGELTAKAGRTALLTIDGTLLTSGNKTLVLTRAESSGDIVFDAVALGGGFKLGNNNNSKFDLTEHPGGTSPSGDYYAYSTNVVLTQVWRDLPHHYSYDYTKQYFHVYVPDEIAGSEECKVVFKSNVLPNTTGYVFALSVNGNEVARKTYETYKPTWGAFECEVPATALVPGDNVFIFANVTGGGYDWCNIDYYQFETKYTAKKPGTVLIFW